MYVLRDQCNTNVYSLYIWAETLPEYTKFLCSQLQFKGTEVTCPEIANEMKKCF